MAFWSKWFQRPVVGTQTSIPPTPRPTFTDSDREYVRKALDRFSAAGLRIWPTLNRDLIIARALLDSERWDLQRIDDDPIEMLFLALADETDCLTYDIDSVEEMFPPLAEITDEAATEMLQIHSYSIFENANTVFEDSSAEKLVHEFLNLTEGVLKINNVNMTEINNGTTIVSFEIEGSGEHNFQIETRKRPDVDLNPRLVKPDTSPLLLEINKIIKERARFLMIYNGSDDSTVVAFMLDTKRNDFVCLLHLVNAQNNNRDIYYFGNWPRAARL